MKNENLLIFHDVLKRQVTFVKIHLKFFFHQAASNHLIRFGLENGRVARRDRR